MKKNLLFLFSLVFGLAAKAETEPVITAVGTVGEERTITIGLNVAGTVQLDWGDGTLVEQTTTQAYDGWDGTAVFTGTPVGEGAIKIYASGVVYFEAYGKYNNEKTDIPNALTSLDVTKATDLTEIAVNANKLSVLDLSKNTKLVKLNIANNQFTTIDIAANTELTNLTANDNQLVALDLSKNTKLLGVTLSGNKLTTLDFSNNKVLKTFTCLNNELTNVTIGANTAVNHTFQFGGNKLTTFSIKDVVNYSGSYVYVRDNQLTELELPGNVKRIWADGNAFTLAQLYALKSKATQTFTYASNYNSEYAQAPYQIAKKIAVNDTIDLSSQAMLGETATSFVWKADGETLVEGTDYKVENGVFVFLTAKSDIYCEMTNTELNAFTAAKPYVTTAANAPVIKAVGTVGEERTITVGLNAAGTVQVDWGDGTLIEQTATGAYSGWDGELEFIGTPVGEGKIKIYADGVIYFDAHGKYNSDKTDIPNALTSLDVTKATDLTEIAVNANKLSALDLSKNTKLLKLNIANNQFTAIDIAANTELTNLTANDNQLAALDLSANTKLMGVVLSNNKLTTLDFSNNKTVKTFTCLNNELTNVTIGANTTANHTFQFGGNKLTTFSIKDVVNYSGSYVYVRDNQLTELELPGNVKRIWADGNAFTLAQLYALKSKATQTFTYASNYNSEYAQVPYQIAESVNVNETVDLSSQATLGETATVFTWKNAEGTALVEGTDYTVADGVFTFLTVQDAIHAEMTNAELNAFTAAKPYLTTSVKVMGTAGISDVTAASAGNDMWYTLEGVQVTQPTKGLYIKNGKKVIVNK